MKRTNILFLSLTFLILNGTYSVGQQRLGLMPERFTLQNRGQTYEAEAFCLDRHRIQAREPVSYTKILSGETAARVLVGSRPPMSLQQAISNGIINITGRSGAKFDSHLSITFVSNVDAPVRIELGTPIAFGQRSSWINPNALTPLTSSRTAYTSKSRQDLIWQAQTYERSLQVLGYATGPSDAVTLPQIRAATKSFQVAHGLRATGFLDTATKEKIDEAAELLRADFNRIGIRVPPPTDTSINDVTDVIRNYQEYLGVEETGLMSEPLRARITADERVLEQVRSVSKLGTSPAADLRAVRASQTLPDVLTFQRYRDGANVIIKKPEGIELWSFFNDKVVQRLSRERAISAFDYLSLRGAATNSSTEMYVMQTGVFRPQGKIRVAFGPGELFELSSEELASFIQGKSNLAAFDERIVKLTLGSSKRPRVLISRSALNQGRGGDAGGIRSPLDESGFVQIDPLRLAHAMNNRYSGKVDVLIANDINRGLVNANHLPSVTSGPQIRVLTDRSHFKDYGTIANVKPDLEAAGIEVVAVEAGNAATDRPSVVLITAKKDAGSLAYLEELAGAGHFKDSVLVLASCGEGCEVTFNSVIIRKSGARAILFYDQKIHPQAVEETVLKFSELLRTKGVPNGNFQQLWQQSIDELLKDPKTPMREEILKLRKSLIQVSAIRSEKPRYGEE